MAAGGGTGSAEHSGAGVGGLSAPASGVEEDTTGSGMGVSVGTGVGVAVGVDVGVGVGLGVRVGVAVGVGVGVKVAVGVAVGDGVCVGVAVGVGVGVGGETRRTMGARKATPARIRPTIRTIPMTSFERDDIYSPCAGPERTASRGQSVPQDGDSGKEGGLAAWGQGSRSQ